MKCKEAIQKQLCLGCNRLEIETAEREADCGYIKDGYRMVKEIIEGIQEKI